MFFCSNRTDETNAVAVEANAKSGSLHLDWLWNRIFNFNDPLGNKAKINYIIEFLTKLNSNSRNFKICKSISEITVCLKLRTIQISKKLSICF